jgi:alpha-mannosidase
MSAWTIGDIVGIDTVAQIESVKITERGPVRACIEAVKHYGRSKFIQRTYLYRSYPRIDFDLEAHWFEQGSPETGVPMLRTVFPLDLNQARFTCHVPFAAVERPVNGQEVPAQKWVDVSDGKTGIALLNKTKYGHSYHDGELRLTLLRSSYYPDIYPNQGLYHMRYALYPHAGDWKNGVWAEGEDVNVPVMAVEPPSFALDKPKARLPLEYSFITVEPSEIVLTGIKQSENGEQLIIRLVEVEGKETIAKLQLPENIKSVVKLDIIERLLDKGDQPVVKDKNVRITLAPYEIVTLGITI